jgi:beta-lactamase superfamily II metal-dependent hydrolase
MASLASLLDAQQQGQANSELIVRLLDVGQGDATYITNGASRVIIDGGPSTATFGRYLDSLNLNNSTIDVVILSHQHLDPGPRGTFTSAISSRTRIRRPR